MAWRIHDSVVRGELDNRTRGRVTGRLWFHGRDEPIQLDLEGNACADLAGCQLRFENPMPTTPLRAEATMAPVQTGLVGDLTASRRVRVFDVSLEVACDLLRRGESPPEHTANCLYLEWFSSQNGLMVVESAEYRLTPSAPEWRLNPAGELERRATVERGWTTFLDRLTEAVRREREKVPSHKDSRSWDEFDYEQFLRESDARTDKLMALYDRYEGHPDADALIAREMGWSPADEAAGRRHRLDAGIYPQPIELSSSLAPDALTEGVDWVRDAQGAPVHPLYLRCHRAGRAAWDAVDLMSDAVQNDPDVSDFIAEVHIATARLAGALNPLAYGRRQCEPPFIVACLKRSLAHLRTAQQSLERIRNRRLLPEAPITAARSELDAVRETVLQLMDEFRRSSRGSA